MCSHQSSPHMDQAWSLQSVLPDHVLLAEPVSYIHSTIYNIIHSLYKSGKIFRFSIHIFG